MRIRRPTPTWRALRPGLLAALCSLAALIASDPSPARAALPPIVPRDLFFSFPERGGALLSPDGRTLSYLARSKAGRMNLWVRDLATGQERAITDDRAGNIFGAVWAPDGHHMLFPRDSNGDENYHLFSVDIATGQLRDLTPFLGVRSAMLLTDARHPREVLVGMNLRNRRVLDMYRVNLVTGAVTLDTENPGDVTEWQVDSSLTIRACVALDSTNSNTILRVRDSAHSPWRTLQEWPFMQSGFDRDQRLIGFSRDGSSLLVLSPLGSRTTRFISLDVKTGRQRDSLPADPRADVWCPFDFANEWSAPSLIRDPHTGAVQAYQVDYLKPEWKVLDPRLRPDFDALAKLHDGVLLHVSRDDADKRWVVAYYTDTGPYVYYLWDRTRQRAESLFVDVPELTQHQFAPMQTVTIKARDGLEIPTYLTLPVGVPAKNLPLIVHPHGGPWARDEWGFSPDVQLLANRGYAVIQPQFRGSTGFGQAYINASVHEMGPGAMTLDLADCVQWAVRQGIADSTRVAIYGGSYGGYVTLCGITFTPQVYSCAVDVVGPSNLRTLVGTFPPYWKARRKRWLLRMGDVVADSMWNQRISPLYHADQVRAPLLIGHGVNDPRVKIAESEAIAAALRKRNIPVTFAVYPDEGHGFTKPANNQDFYGRMEDFFAKYLHGRAESWKKVDGSSVELR